MRATKAELLHLRDVLHVPLLGYNLISESEYEVVQGGHTISSDLAGTKITLKDGAEILFPYVGKLPCKYGSRIESVEAACATIAPGLAPTTPTTIEINHFHCTHAHTHEVLLKETA